MPSPEYAALTTRINALSARFVDFDIPIDQNPTQDQLDSIAAFKLLAHAEFETFIETRISQAIQGAVNHWSSTGRVTKPLFALLLRWYPWFEKDKNTYFAPQQIADVALLMQRLLKNALEEIAENNGIKKDTFSRLSYSAGLFTDDHQAMLLAALESYGKNRGDVAHNAVGKVRTINDPRVEAADAKQIVDFLEPFDQQLIDLIV